MIFSTSALEKLEISLFKRHGQQSLECIFFYFLLFSLYFYAYYICRVSLYIFVISVHFCFRPPLGGGLIFWPQGIEAFAVQCTVQFLWVGHPCLAPPPGPPPAAKGPAAVLPIVEWAPFPQGRPSASFWRGFANETKRLPSLKGRESCCFRERPPSCLRVGQVPIWRWNGVEN